MEISTRGRALGAGTDGEGDGDLEEGVLEGLGREVVGTKSRGTWVENSVMVGGMVLRARGDREE